MQEAHQKYNLEHLLEGLSVHRALELFLSACNKHDTLFITDRWIQPRLKRLQALLSDPITSDEAEALRDAVMKSGHLDDVIEWLEDKTIPWPTYNAGRKWLAQETESLRNEQEVAKAVRAFMEAEKARKEKGRITLSERQRNDTWLQIRYPAGQARKKYADRAKPCPRCGKEPEDLTWFHCVGGPELETWPSGAVCVLFRHLFGWMTYCDHCDIDVDFFVEHYM